MSNVKDFSSYGNISKYECFSIVWLWTDLLMVNHTSSSDDFFTIVELCGYELYSFFWGHQARSSS